MTTYIDTSALVWRYIPGPLTPTLDALLEGKGPNYTHELTVLEWSSTLGKTILRKDMRPSDFGPNELALFTDIAEQRLRVIRTARVIGRARDLIRYVAVIGGRQLRTVDAIHLASALDLSIQIGSLVDFVTCDERLKNAAELNGCKPHLTAHYLKQ